VDGFSDHLDGWIFPAYIITRGYNVAVNTAADLYAVALYDRVSPDLYLAIG
jgi:hypothetical protein